MSYTVTLSETLFTDIKGAMSFQEVGNHWSGTASDMDVPFMFQCSAESHGIVRCNITDDTGSAGPFTAVLPFKKVENGMFNIEMMPGDDVGLVLSSGAVSQWELGWGLGTSGTQSYIFEWMIAGNFAGKLILDGASPQKEWIMSGNGNVSVVVKCTLTGEA